MNITERNFADLHIFIKILFSLSQWSYLEHQRKLAMSKRPCNDFISISLAQFIQLNGLFGINAEIVQLLILIYSYIECPASYAIVTATLNNYN